MRRNAAPRELALLSKAQKALAEAVDVHEVKDIRDKAEAVRAYYRQIGDSLEAQNSAAEIKLRAERRLGEMLAAMDKQRPGEYQRSHDVTVAPSLQDMGITKMQSSRWQLEAAVPDAEFEAYIATARSRSAEITASGLQKLGRQLRAKEVTEVQAEVAAGNGCSVVCDLDELRGQQKFGCIYADPPWQYGNQATRASTDNHYATMRVEEVCDLPIEDLAADCSHLHLWTTNAFLRDAFRVIDAWGFVYKSCFVWVKPQMGIGNYWRVSHEFLLLGVRGSAPFRDKTQISWREMARTKHSAKPAEVRAVLEKASPGPYLELFGRTPVDGWTVFGNQVRSQLFAT